MNAEYRFRNAKPDLMVKLNSLYTINNWRNFCCILLDYGMIAGSIAASIILQDMFMYLVAVIIIGSRMRALENLMHESVHGMLFLWKRTNYFAGLILCALPIGRSVYAYTQAHALHHIYLGDAEQDPDARRYRKIGIDDHLCGRGRLLMQFLRVILLWDTWAYLKHTFSVCIELEDTPLKESVTRVLFYMAVGIAAYWFDMGIYCLLYWVVPFFTTYQIIRFFAEIAEHSGLCDEASEVLRTRNNVISPVCRFLIYPHGGAYHLAHHLFPDVPHHNLSKCHKLLMGWDEYARAHHCYSYFYSLDIGLPSTFREMSTIRPRSKKQTT